MSVDIEARRRRQKEYYERRKARDPEGLRKATTAASMRWRAKNQERQRASVRKWREANPDYQAVWREKNRTRYSQKTRERRHKCKQRYPAPECCECCNIILAETTKGPQFDHCHAQLFHRGWLCNSCNNAIARLGDSIEGVMRAIIYLKKAEAAFNG
jgi:Recombination endonuclease VII